MHATEIVSADRLPFWTVLRQNAQQCRDAEAGPVPRNQGVEIVPAGAVAARTRDDQHRSMPGDLFQRDGSAWHSRLITSSYSREKRNERIEAICSHFRPKAAQILAKIRLIDTLSRSAPSGLDRRLSHDGGPGPQNAPQGHVPMAVHQMRRTRHAALSALCARVPLYGSGKNDIEGIASVVR